MRAARILEGIRQKTAVVVGDICLDRWCTYDPALAEPSRETGIPRTAVISTEVTPGAAGTVAGNLAALGVREVAVLGVIGDDGFGFELRRALASRGIRADHAVVAPGIPTFTYTKLLNARTGEEDLPRVDFVYTEPMPAVVEAALVARLREAFKEFDVVLVSDQAETDAGGVITAPVRDALSELARSTPDKVVWVDSRMRGEQFRDVLVKCNESEAEQACARAFGRLDLDGLRERIGPKPLVITRGESGAVVVTAEGKHAIPTRTVAKPVDICGAGDSFSAGAAMALAITGSCAEAAWFGNLVSSITIMKKGTGTASPSELLEAEQQWQP